MKPFAHLLIYICLITNWLSAQTFQVENLLVNGPKSKRINLVYMSDGYTSAELGSFVSKAQSVNTSLFAQSPFLEYRNFFNAYAVKVASAESGAIHPGTATDVSEPASPVKSPNNYFDSRFDVGGIHRLLVPGSSFQVLSVAGAAVPEYDQVLMLVNDTEYGGSGGTIATSSINSTAQEIMYHEIGHSFAYLGDEYWFSCAEQKNRTANNDPETIIWKKWLNSNNIGIYPIGSSGPAANCFRPHEQCKMRALGYPFCAVCKEAFIDRIYELVSPIENFTPAATDVTFAQPSMPFTLSLILPEPNTLNVEWVLNDTIIATATDSINITASQLLNGINFLEARVSDATLLSRAYWPESAGYLHGVTWMITADLSSSPVVNAPQLNKIRYEIFPNPADDLLNVRVQTQVKNEIILRVTDMNGRLVLEQPFEPTESLATEMPVKNLAPGQYTLTIQAGQSRISRIFEKL